MQAGRGALFLDRDGVLNRLAFNPATAAWESPHRPEDMQVTPGLGGLLVPFVQRGLKLYLVSNQPSWAKGKCSRQDLDAVHGVLDAALKAEGIRFAAYHYCYHHPDSIVPELKGPCECRKPSPYFVQKSLREDGLDPAACWMIGDQDSDMECGRSAGLRCALVETLESAPKRGRSRPDLKAADLAGALQAILALM